MEPVRLPDEAAFRAFQAECETELGWLSRYNRDGIAVWGQLPPQGDVAVHRVKGRVNMPDVSAETVFDVLHDTEYRKKWDLNVIETHEIARLSDNADVGYYSWKCPKPLKNRDVVTLRSWRVLDKSYVILNFSVKHQKYPPRKDLVRAVSLLAGYLVQPTGPNSCCLTYLAQVDPKGSLPKWVVNKASQYLAPKSPAARSTGDQVLQLLIQNPPFFLKICKLATFASWRYVSKDISIMLYPDWLMLPGEKCSGRLKVTKSRYLLQRPYTEQFLCSA